MDSNFPLVEVEAKPKRGAEGCRRSSEESEEEDRVTMGRATTAFR